MELIRKQELKKAGHVSRLPIGSLLMKLLKINQFNEIYAQVEDKQAQEFINATLDALEVNLKFNEQELSRIPTGGAFTTISNHPLGGLDGLLLLKLLGEQRTDFKVLANKYLEKVEQIQDSLITLPAQDDPSAKVKVIKTALQHLENGSPLGIFPAGKVSKLHRKGNIDDTPWSDSAIKLIKKAGVPVVPIYFHGANSLVFHLLSAFKSSFGKAKLPSEWLNKKKKEITIRIGKPIGVNEIEAFDNIPQLGRFLRSKTYALGYPLKVKRFFQFKKRFKQQAPVPIEPPVPSEVLKAEIETLEPHELLVEKAGFQLFLTEPYRIPNVLNEIGRLREITFREVGEGTNKSIDLDEFDLYYRHLFLWDTKQERIAGAYRIGLGPEIMSRYGRKGFYIRTLFKTKPALDPVMKQAMELGRSFVVKDYQRQRHPLYLLWQGILFELQRNTDIRYVIGPVSISDDYTKLSRKLMAAFLKQNHYDEMLGQFVKPKKEFSPKLKKAFRALLSDDDDSLKKLDRLIEDIEPDHFRVPVLVKKYLKQNARILAFNRDPKFNDSLDVFMLMDIKDLPADTFDRLARDFATEINQ